MNITFIKKLRLVIRKYHRKALLVMLSALLIVVSIQIWNFVSPDEASAAWYNDDWSMRKQFTIDESKVPGSSNFSNFPLLVNISDNNLKDIAQTDGDDILFTSGDGTTVLDHEIESYDSSTGTLTAWVEVPTLYAQQNTQIFMYYGNPSAVNQEDVNGTWNSGYVGVWHLNETVTDESTGGTHVNSTGNSGLNGSQVNSNEVSGRVNYGQDFDGTGDYIDINDPGTDSVLDFGSGDTINISAWVNFDNFPVSEYEPAVIIAKGDTDSADTMNYTVYVHQVGGLYNIIFIYHTTSGFIDAISEQFTAGEFPTDTWHHIAVQYTFGNSSSAAMWFNGQSISVPDAADNNAPTESNDSLWLGATGDAGSPSSEMDGFLDEVRISNTTRSTDWLATEYSNQNDPSGFFTSITTQQNQRYPILQWKFDEGYGSTANDSTTFNNDGTINGPTWQNKDLCLGGSCLLFDGTDDLVAKTYSTDTDLDPGSDDFSVSAWFRHPSTISGTDTLISRADGVNGVGYKLYMDSSGYICFGMDASAGTFPSDSACSTTSYADSKWHHVEGVKDGTSSITLYVDGVQISQDVSIASGSISGTSSAFRVGIDADGTSNPWTGFVDDVKYFDYAKSAAEIKTSFASKNSRAGTSASFGPDNSWLSDGLVGYWKMDEAGIDAEGETITDYSGNSYLGTLYGDNSTGDNGSGMSCTLTGKFGTGCDHDGVDDYVDFGNILGFTSSFSVSAWVNLDEYHTGTDQDHIINKTGANRDWSLSIHSPTDSSEPQKASIRISSNSSDTIVRYSSQDIPLDTWTHITGIYDASTQSLDIYINGIKDNGTLGGTVPSSIAASSNNLEFMRRSSNGTYVDGTLDETRIYNRALSPAEIRQLADWAPGPVVYFPLDENTGTSTVYDKSGTNLTGTMNGSMTESDWTPGKFGSALDFDGSDDNINGGSAAIINDIPTLTAMAWIKPRTDGETAGRIIHKGTNTQRWSLWVDDPTTVQVGFSADYDGGQDLSRATTSSVNFNEWMHVAVTWTGSGTSSTVTIYINGIAANSYAIDQNGTGNRLTDASGDIYIGEDSGGTRAFDGQIDDVRIYNYARTPGQIIEDMNGGHPAPGSPVGSAALWWKFDDLYAYPSTSDGEAINSGYTGTADDGAISQNCAISADGKFGSSLLVNSSDCFAGQNDISFFDGLTQMTISLWVNPTTLTTERLIMGKSQHGSQENFQIWTNSSSSSEIDICIASSTSDYCGNYFTTSGLGLAQGTWTHVLLVYDSSQSASDRVKAYKNGIPVSGSVTGTLPTSMTSGTTSTFSLGLNTSGSQQNPLLSYYDELKIYTSALTADQAKVEYNHGSMAIMGALSTDASGNASWSSSREFCPPGNTEGNCGGSNDPSPSFWYKMDENTDNNCDDGSGTDVCDSTTNQQHGTNTNMESSDWVPGKLGGGLSFDGVNEYVTVLDHSGNDIAANQSFTLESWVYIRAFPGAGNYDDIFQKNGAFWLEINDTNDFNFGFWDSPSYIDFDITTPDLQTNTWYHIIGVYEYVDGTNNKVNMYLNGSKIYTTTTSAEPSGSGTDGLTIGALDASNQQFNGVIDDVRYYKYARTPAQVAWDYNRGKPAGWWRMDECTGTAANDASGKANHGTITIGASGTNTSAGTCSSGTSTEAWNNGTTGKVNASLNFDGTDDYVDVGDISELEPAGTTDGITITAWVSRESYNTFDVIVAKDNNIATTTTNGYALYIAPNDVLIATFGDGTNGIFAQSSKTILNSNWVHITATFDGLNNSAKIYVDGVLSGTSSGGANNGVDNALDLVIGAESDGGEPFDGKIDDVRIYNHVLTQAQIRTVMNTGAAHFGP